MHARMHSALTSQAAGEAKWRGARGRPALEQHCRVLQALTDGDLILLRFGRSSPGRRGGCWKCMHACMHASFLSLRSPAS
jgi:hypothetical protein